MNQDQTPRFDKQFIVVDMDGTLSDHTPRLHLAQAGDWDAFNEEAQHDKPFYDVRYLLFLLDGTGSNFSIIILTGRDEAHRPALTKWLGKYDILADTVLMRPAGDRTPDHILKLQMLEAHFGSKGDVLANVAFALEDRDKVVEAFRNYGLPCWQVRAGTY